ncbi:MAG: N-acetylglucosamine-6-phosphate deacetylase [Candidatus Asgardarchaeia archaeon]
MFSIKVSKVFTPYTTIDDAYITVEDGKISKVSKEKPEGVEVEDFSDKIATPGFIDVHIHGMHGKDVAMGTEEAVEVVTKNMPRYGVTSYFPTIVTSPYEGFERSIKSIIKVSEKNVGADILGIHIEGPYLSKEKKGAQPEEYIRKPDLEEFKKLYDISGGLLKRMTIAPEAEGALDLIREATQMGVVMSMGHSNATYDVAIKAIELGARSAIHTFNGMRGYHHREPGILGAVLTTKNVMAEAIVDLIHLHPATVKLIYLCKGVHEMILITDAIAATGLPDGTYELGTVTIIVKDGISRTKSGALAGSTLTMNRAVRNMVEHVGVSFQDALIMATANPARLMSLKGKGAIAPGFDADITIVDKDMNVYATYVRGELKFSKEQ